MCIWLLFLCCVYTRGAYPSTTPYFLENMCWIAANKKMLTYRFLLVVHSAFPYGCCITAHFGATQMSWMLQLCSCLMPLYKPSARMHSEGWFVSVCVCEWVCLSVHLLPRFLRLRATRQRNSDTNRFIATLASFKKRRFWYNFSVQKLWPERQVNKPICKLAQAYISVCLQGTRSHKEGRMSLSHAIYYCS